MYELFVGNKPNGANRSALIRINLSEKGWKKRESNGGPVGAGAVRRRVGTLLRTAPAPTAFDGLFLRLMPMTADLSALLPLARLQLFPPSTVNSFN